MRKAIALLVFCTPLIGVAPIATADAKKPSTRARVKALEKSVKKLTKIVNEQNAAIIDAYAYTAAVESCLLAVGVNSTPFSLDGVSDPLELLFIDGSDEPGAWVALIDSSCVVEAQAARSTGRSFRLRVPK